LELAKERFLAGIMILIGWKIY